MTVRIHLLHTHVAHWGHHAGVHQFVQYLDPEKYAAKLSYVSDSDADLPIPNARLRRVLRNYVQRRGMPWYKLSDLAAELRTLPKALFNSIDILHYLDGEHSAQYLPMWLKKWHSSRTKTLATFHQPVKLLDGLINPQIVAELDHVNLVSPSQISYFRQFLPAERISVIPHGIDTEFFKPKAIRSSRTVFRCVSAGYWLRDWNAIREVAIRLSGEPDIEFHVVASWPTGMEELDNVTIHTRISDESLLSIYQQCDALLLPLTDATANNTILEAISCGVPVISTDLEAVRGYLPGVEGILVQRNSADQLADAVIYLKKNPDLRRRLAECARRRAEELSWHRVAPCYEKLYADLLKAGHSRQRTF